ncbi:MAG: amylo-alpha-1,6-glucosidase [Patescibacteria group bacterium]|nr:amylo-alpha-1,6-glucosidase [Patescibacteria group bacterium]
MQITHQYKNTKVAKKSVDGTGLILGNNLGNYFYMTDEKESRYQGFFYANGENDKYELEVYKIIDQINIFDKGKLDEIKNNFFEIEKKYESGIIEKYFLPKNKSTLCLEINKTVTAEIILDIRHPYDTRNMGRLYDLQIVNGCILVKYTKRRDWSEDQMGDKKEYTLYLAIKTDQDNYKKIGEFFSKHYQKDQERNSYPWDRFVYKAIEIEFKKAVFSVAKTKKAALEEAEISFANIDKLNKQTEENIVDKLKIPSILDEEIKMACLCAQNSIYTLSVKNDGKHGAYAGLPWFFQFWHRDEAISLLQICKFNKDLSEKIILSQLKTILNNGQLPKNRFFKIEEKGLQSADALGWLANRIIKILEQFNIDEAFKTDLIEGFERAVMNLLKEKTVNDLAVNSENETWMDSLGRNGNRIEIQACRYNIYNLLHKLTQNNQYEALKNELLKKTREKFYLNKILSDSPEDNTIRPNIFITAYLFPELLKNNEWEKCFDKILPKLYLSWGGISSVDVKSDKFIPKDTGENSDSYHNGNSWYWINNLTALVLYKTNSHKYSTYINEIMEANTNEILFYGIAGHHSEVSAAEKQTSSGCEAQLWSSAMYLEVFDEILK